MEQVYEFNYLGCIISIRNEPGRGAAMRLLMFQMMSSTVRRTLKKKKKKKDRLNFIKQWPCLCNYMAVKLRVLTWKVINQIQE